MKKSIILIAMAAAFMFTTSTVVVAQNVTQKKEIKQEQKVENKQMQGKEAVQKDVKKVENSKKK